MFGINQTQKIFIYGKLCDMRKGFEGLFGLVQNEMELNPLSVIYLCFSANTAQKSKFYFGIMMV